MKRFYLLLMAMTMFLASYAQEIRVNNAKDLFQSIDDNRTIIIENGSVLNLTEAILQLHEEDPLTYPRFKYVSPGELFGKIVRTSTGSQESDDDMDTPQKGIYIQDEENGGPRVCIAGITNLTIKGEGPVVPVLFADSQVEYSLVFDGCSNIALDHLVLGGLYLKHGKKVNISKCDLRGGSLGCFRIFNLDFVDCQIYDSPNYIIHSFHCDKFNFDHCAFYNCSNKKDEDFELIRLLDTRTVCFNNCLFFQNQGNLFRIIDLIKLKKCFVSHPIESRGDIDRIKDQRSVWFDERR